MFFHSLQQIFKSLRSRTHDDENNSTVTITIQCIDGKNSPLTCSQYLLFYATVCIRIQRVLKPVCVPKTRRPNGVRLERYICWKLAFSSSDFHVMTTAVCLVLYGIRAVRNENYYSVPATKTHALSSRKEMWPKENDSPSVRLVHVHDFSIFCVFKMQFTDLNDRLASPEKHRYQWFHYG